MPLLEQVLNDAPERLPAVEALASLRLKQKRTADAIALRQRVYALRPPTPAELVQLGQLAMSEQNTPLAIDSFEAARRQQGAAFTHDLELGVLYLAARRFADARERARPRAAVTPGLPDGALQTRAGQRAAERARQGRAHRPRAQARGRDDAGLDRERKAVPKRSK